MTDEIATTVYVAGPMRGYPLMNFPAFDEATATLRAQGYEVTSPAEMDREHGYDGTRPMTEDELVLAFERDFDAVRRVDAVVLLPGWEESEGTGAELSIALRRLPVPVIGEYRDGKVTWLDYINPKLRRFR